MQKLCLVLAVLGVTATASVAEEIKLPPNFTPAIATNSKPVVVAQRQTTCTTRCISSPPYTCTTVCR